MKKTKTYYNTRFPANVVDEAHALFLSKSGPAPKQEGILTITFSITKEDEQWEYDSVEEFLAEYPQGQRCYLWHLRNGNSLTVTTTTRYCEVQVKFASRADIESVFQVFERNRERSAIALAAPEPLRIFIGHGHDPQWRDLKDHLHDQHGLDVTHYEIGPRAGLSVKEVLESMLTESSFALLVLTAEDIDLYGQAHARENVVHELGLFQGQLGFTRAIALVEQELPEFSNILGLNQIRFNKGHIRETYGDILATIKREFEEGD